MALSTPDQTPESLAGNASHLGPSPAPHQRSVALTILALAVFLAASLLISLWNVSDSGALWPDASQYANAGAMVHDWLRSGDLLHPWQFAQKNYARYPAFHLPYHPPVYPGLLGLLFVLTGVSWETARAFTALSLWASVSFLFLILLRFGVPRFGALLACLAMITAPVVATWSRDTMSEVPGLAFAMAATWMFLRWLDDDRLSSCLAAAFLAEAAFLSRLLTAGMIPAWFLFALPVVGWRRLVKPAPVIIWATWLAANALWVTWVKQYSRFETFSGGVGPNRNYGGPLQVARYYLTELPSITGIPLLLLAVAGVVAIFWLRDFRYRRQALWPILIATYIAFLGGVGIFSEGRYLICAIPGFAGLAAAGYATLAKRGPTYARAAAVVMTCCIAVSALQLRALPEGLTGYMPVAEAIAGQKAKGNVLVGAPSHADLIFRYRTVNGAPLRTFLRADRVLALRPPGYFDAPTALLAKSAEEVLAIVRRGRVRYVVTFVSDTAPTDSEVALLHRTSAGAPNQFALIGKWPLHMHHREKLHLGDVYLWSYLGELQPGESEIPVAIPTADITLRPNGEN